MPPGEPLLGHFRAIFRVARNCHGPELFAASAAAFDICAFVRGEKLGAFCVVHNARFQNKLLIYVIRRVKQRLGIAEPAPGNPSLPRHASASGPSPPN